MEADGRVSEFFAREKQALGDLNDEVLDTGSYVTDV